MRTNDKSLCINVGTTYSPHFPTLLDQFFHIRSAGQRRLPFIFYCFGKNVTYEEVYVEQSSGEDDQPLVTRLAMTIDNENIGFLILWGLVIAATVFVVRLFRARNLCPNCGDPTKPEMLQRLKLDDPRAPVLEGIDLKLTQIVRCKRCGHKWRRTHPGGTHFNDGGPA